MKTRIIIIATILTAILCMAQLGKQPKQFTEQQVMEMLCRAYKLALADAMAFEAESILFRNGSIVGIDNLLTTLQRTNQFNSLIKTGRFE